MPKIALAEPATLRSGCKINLCLEITGRLENGYHSLKTFLLPLSSPCDVLHIGQGRREGLALTCSEPWLDPHDNTLRKTYDLFREAENRLPDLEIHLEKGVPAGAGLGGGSADAAALLLFLENCLQQTGLPGLGREKLNEIAARIGADVPFFLLNRPAWAEGFGERLTPAACALPGIHLVLVCPEIAVSTAWAYRAWDARQEEGKVVPPDTTFLTSPITQATYLSSVAFAGPFFNDFEPVVFKAFPALRDIKEHLLALGAESALMSGSGSSIFGLFSLPAQAKKAADFCQQFGRVYCQAIHAGASPSW